VQILYLKELTLINFRNYEKLNISFNSNLILLIGKNAQGKTNILESISMSSTGRSYRTPRDKELIKWGKGQSYVKNTVIKRSGTSVIELYLNLQEKKRIKINGVQIKRMGELMGHLNSVVFSPEDLRIIKDGPAERRRFMDMEISQIKPRYFYNLQQYNKILLQRNNLLKEINIRPNLKKTLPVWDEQLSHTGAYIINERYKFVRMLMESANHIHRDISFGAENLEFFYKSSIKYKDQGVDHIKDNFFEQLQKNRDFDIMRGTTSSGCHRDDLAFVINDVDIRTFGSQGQQRSSVLSLKLSEIEIMHRETGEYPILLLDDVMSELDEYRQEMLLDIIGDVQTIITSTSLKGIPKANLDNGQVFTIQNGGVI
jgi:DNA replication and repair protein RecF